MIAFVLQLEEKYKEKMITNKISTENEILGRREPLNSS